MAENPRQQPQFGSIKTVQALGTLLRSFRKQQGLTLERVSGLLNVSMRFLSELERGKETVQMGKVLDILTKLGLDIIIQPRSFSDQNNDQ